MGYYIRAFCTSSRTPPTIDEVLKGINLKGAGLFNFEIDPDFQDTDVNSQEWKEVGFIYKEGVNPILCEISRDDGTEDCLMRVEIEEFKEEIDKVKSKNKKKVLNHLNKTKFTIVNQLSGNDEDLLFANQVIMDFFVQEYGGMVQADGEGFYEKHKLLVELGW